MKQSKAVFGFVVAVLLVSVLVIGVRWALVGSEVKTARRHVAAGTGLMNDDFPWSDEVRRELGLPSMVFSRSEAIKHYLCPLADERPEQFGHLLFFVARHFLAEDCAQAEHYISLYLERGVDRRHFERATRVLELIRSEGCPAAMGWLREEGQDLLAD